jgi:hypothetical protein
LLSDCAESLDESRNGARLLARPLAFLDRDAANPRRSGLGDGGAYRVSAAPA